jgi:tetratricopeptide (TPR) repeat protein
VSQAGQRAVWSMALVALAWGAPARAQQEWKPPACELKSGHFLVNSALLYLRHADSTQFPDQREHALRDANRVLIQALTSGDQQKNPAAWYYLGRYYIDVKDEAGVDSAFAKAAELAPRCQDDINSWRRRLWVPVLNAGIAAWQAGNLDSAIAAFRRANLLYDGEPTGFTYLATLFANSHQADSGAKYFKLAVKAAADPKYLKDRKDAMYNLARVYQGAGRLDEASAAYQVYVAAYPGDIQAIAGLASVYAQTGRRDEAMAMYAQVLARADSAEAEDLFSVGREMLNGIPKPPDTASQGGQCRSEARAHGGLTAHQIAVRCDSATTRAMRDYDADVRGAYHSTEQAFAAGLAKRPNDRDALLTLTGIAALAGDSGQALDAGRRLYAVDPLNRTSIRMLAQAWKVEGRIDSTLHFLQVADSLSVEVSIGTFSPDDKGAALTGLFTNLRPKPSQPLTLIFEFLDAHGSVIASHPEDVRPIEPSGNRAFDIRVAGSGIVTWRYRR